VLLDLEALISGLLVVEQVEYGHRPLDRERQKVELDHNQHQVQSDHMLAVEMVV